MTAASRPIALALLALGCGGTLSTTDASMIADAHDDDIPWPSTPVVNDPAFTVTARGWLMAGDGLTPRSESFEVSVAAPATTRIIDAWIDGVQIRTLERRADGVFHASLPVPAAIGEHVLLLAADRGPTAFASRPFRVSSPLYAVVSVDWDDANPPQVNLDRMDALRQHHPRLVYSQFVGPYVFTDPVTTEPRRQELVAWLRRARDAGDEMGVHIHPRCTFVGTTTVPCRSMPSTVTPTGDASGYTVIFASYTVEEQTTMLRDAAALMVRNGFATPTSFRAGGWTSQLSTLDACDRAGYTVESSAFPPDTIQRAWAGTELARWNLSNWTGITNTSQPYHPSRSNLVSATPAPNFTVLEVPDNGTLVDYMTGMAMIDVLTRNFPDGLPLPTSRVFQVGLHPGSYSASLASRLENALNEVDLHLYANDAGPIVYARLSDLTRVW